MSSTALEVQQEAQRVQQEELRRRGLENQYRLWRESMPEENSSLSEAEAFELFMNSVEMERAAIEGRLSVTSGAMEDEVAGTIPTPGPDGQEDRPDEAGDTSQGGGGGSGTSRIAAAASETADESNTELIVIPGMWVPPPESEAENYEPPSTAEMASHENEEWMEAARTFWEFSGSPNTRGPWVSGSGNFGTWPTWKDEEGNTRYDAQPMQDEHIAQWAKERMSAFNWNVAETLVMAHALTTADDPEAALAFLNLLNMYDHSDGGVAEFGRALGGIGTDPTTYTGLGVGSIAAKGAARLTAKKQLTRFLQLGIVGSVAGGTEAGFLSGGYDLAVQNIEQEAGAREDIDYGQAAKSTLIGIGFGTFLGGGIGGYLGRRMDRYAADVERELSRLLGGERVDADRAADLAAEADEVGIEGLIEMLQASERASAEAGEVDRAAQLAQRYLMDRDALPLRPDGTLDEEAIALELIEMQRVDAEQAAQRRLATNVEILNSQDTSDLIRVTEDGIEWRADYEHYGPIAEVAEDMGLTTMTTQGPEGGWVMTIDGSADDLNRFLAEATGVENVQIGPMGRRADDVAANEDFTTAVDRETGRGEPRPLSEEESQRFAERIREVHAQEGEEVIPRTAQAPGSRVRTIDDDVAYEVMGRTQNGWYRLRNRTTGEEVNKRRNQFVVDEARPAPDFAGPMELKPFSTAAARIIAMNEQILNQPNKLKEVKITHAETRALVEELQSMGINITEKDVATHWTPAELMFLRDTYNAQAMGMADLARRLESDLRNNGRLTDEQLAMFNEAHTQFVATRDLFYGVSGNAARQLNILRSRPTDDVYEFSQSLMDSISLQGGRHNTERAITMMAEFARGPDRLKKGTTANITEMSEKVWGNQIASAMLNFRYNQMLSSWRTHFFNFLGNSASGVYQHLVVSPIRMGINNLAYARDLARAVIDPKYTPDPRDRMTRRQYFAELRGHVAATWDSLRLAKEILMGRDIGEGKIWNELGLRYNVVNVPQSMLGKAGTLPVRALEAGDAFFKNQYFNSKIHELASIKAEQATIDAGLTRRTAAERAEYNAYYDEHYARWIEDPDAPMQREAQAFAAKQTYTNDPNVYGGVLAALARGVSEAQNRSVAVNMLIPFVRTPANLLSYSMEMIGANTVLSPSKTYNALMNGTIRESQEAQARLWAAAGLWIAVHEMYQNGDITGTGPSNWEERQVWEAAGWQPNSIRIGGKWYSMERAAPAGQSLATIASVYDFYAMTQQQNKEVPAWIGAGLLYTADMIIDESYLSTATDFITAIQSKEEARARSVGASMINSILIPNLLRDIRRTTDEQMRSSRSTNLLDQVWKQMQNASPWWSENLPPQRDWRGDPKNYYGNAYQRGLIPFNVRDPEDTDTASMALAYARIGVSAPDRNISIPETNDSINLFAMDNGGGWVYDKYVELVGEHRAQAVDILIGTAFWARMVEEENVGPGSEGERALREALAIGTQNGRDAMLGWLIEHSGENNTFRRENGDLIQIQHQFDVSTYLQIRQMVRQQRLGQPEDTEQYVIEERREGPEFFRPN